MNEQVTISREEYASLIAARENLEDIQAIEKFKARLARGEEEFLPSGLVDRMVAGESPVKVWREHRGLSVSALADAAGIHRTNLHGIESGRRGPSVETLKRLADALGVAMDDLA